MRRLLRLVSLLYPKRWRQRYAQEFDALLDDVNPGWRDFLNVFWGALAMQLKHLSAVPLICGLLGALIGVGVSLRHPASYQSTAMIQLHLGDEIPQSRGYQGRDGFIPTAIQNALKDYTHSREATRVLFIDSTAESSTPIMEVAFSGPDAATAQGAMQEVVGLLEAHPTAAVRFETLNPPTVPRRPSPQDRVPAIALGCGIGLVGGALVVWGGRRLRA